ncbi:MAG: metallophosphoesterase family protein [Planctomycetaceae bacterium]
MQLAFFGGIYNNHLALAAAIADARSRGVDAMWCLGDLGAFGPHPDRTCELIRENGISVVQGNYDHSIGHGLNDCHCGYTDPRDNYFAQLSYDYTLAHTHDDHRAWLRSLPTQQRLEIDDVRLLLCHGSPRRTNEFLWESTTSTQFLAKLGNDFVCDVILGTHTGLHWTRSLDPFAFINVGVLGRPENDGTTNVWYTLLRTGSDARAGRSPLLCEVEFVPLAYDHEQLAREMRDERLPDEFIETILTGWWTTCLEVLPAKERRRGQF